MKYLFLLSCSLLVTAPVWAQSAGDDGIVLTHQIRDELITVVATGSRERLDRSGQSISVIGADEIESIQGPDLTRVLERLPGVTFTRNGGLGGFTGVRLRGAEAEQLLVLVDGVRVADVAAPGGGYDFGNLQQGNITKVELLRGSNSIVWGSDAIGGVLALTTKQMTGVDTSVEYGSNNTIYVTAAGGFQSGGTAGSLTASFHDSDGISTFANGKEPDGLRQWQITGKLRQEIGSDVAITANGRYADGNLDIDGYPGPAYVFGDTNETQKTKEASARIGAEYQGGSLTLSAAFAIADTKRAYFDPAFRNPLTFESHGRSQRAELSGRWSMSEKLSLDFGADTDWTRFSTTYDAEATARLSSVHALLGYHDDRFSLSVGGRYDNHDRFGDAWTLGANASFRIADGWRIRASYGEGFKAPTLYQAFSFLGNPTLRPERSQSYDLGIEKGDRNGALHLAATLFRRDSFDLIQYLPCVVCASFRQETYQNVALGRAEGFELEADFQPIDRIRLHAAYTYVKATDQSPVKPFVGNFYFGKDLARRPRNAFTLAADWRTPLHDLTFGADLRVVSHSFDDAGNFTKLDGYALVGLRAKMPITEQIELFGRIENLTDERYQTAATFGTNGRTATIGARARF